MRMKLSEITELEIGDVFYEAAYGQNIMMTVATKPVVSTGVEDRQVVDWTAINKDGRTTEYQITEGLEHYGPQIYRQPAYA